VTSARVVRRIAVAFFVLLALGFFTIAVHDAWHDTGGELPSVRRVAVAAVLFVFAMACGAFAWGTLVGEGRRLDHGAVYIVAQPAKYVPGGVWQAAGQVSLSRATGMTLGRGLTTFATLAIAQTVAGCTYAIPLALAWSSAPVLVRIALGAGGVGALALLDRRWLVFLLHSLRRWRAPSPDHVPPQRAIAIAWAASVVMLGAMAASYTVMLEHFGPSPDRIVTGAGYVVAWTAGFVIAPIPAGLGVREAVAAAILHDGYSSSVLVAASVYQRLVALATEGTLALAFAHRVHPRRLSERA
jgi:uncharacterized membrane protein YbhN (UPF0104 family)